MRFELIKGIYKIISIEFEKILPVKFNLWVYLVDGDDYNGRIELFYSIKKDSTVILGYKLDDEHDENEEVIRHIEPLELAVMKDAILEIDTNIGLKSVRAYYNDGEKEQVFNWVELHNQNSF